MILSKFYLLLLLPVIFLPNLSSALLKDKTVCDLWVKSQSICSGKLIQQNETQKNIFFLENAKCVGKAKLRPKIDFPEHHSREQLTIKDGMNVILFIANKKNSADLYEITDMPWGLIFENKVTGKIDLGGPLKSKLGQFLFTKDPKASLQQIFELVKNEASQCLN